MSATSREPTEVRRPIYLCQACKGSHERARVQPTEDGRLSQVYCPDLKVWVPMCLAASDRLDVQRG